MPRRAIVAGVGTMGVGTAQVLHSVGTIGVDLVDAGHLGRKSGRGFYR